MRELRWLARGALALLVAGIALSPAPVLAQYPNKAVRLVIPFPPGGSNDVVGRTIAAELSTRLQQPVVVENVGGAGALIGTDMVARAPADGYTLLLVSVAFAFNPAIYKLPYDPATAFAPVAILGVGAGGGRRHGETTGCDAAGSAGTREGETGGAQLCDGRRGELPAPGERALQAPGRHRHRPRAVQGRRARR